MDISSTIKFRNICNMFENMKNAKTTQRKEKILHRYFESFCRHRMAFRQQAGISDNHPEDGKSSFFSVLRLLMPGTDTSRDNYGLQITALGRVYTRVLQLARDSPDAISLQHKSYTPHRDYADVVHAVLKSRCFNNPSDLTLLQIHEMLDIIANEDTQSKDRELTRFTEVASPLEQKWMVRLLLKTMNLGIGEQRIFALLHPNARDVYLRCTDLARVCNLLADRKLSPDVVASTGDDPNNATGTSTSINFNAVIAPFHQIRPMLCERFPGKIEELMQSDVLYMEIKMDGERFQLHFANNRFKYISRNGADFTRNFGDSYEHGNLTPKLRTLLPLDMQSIILDGEMMIWDKNQKRFREKSENNDVKHLSDDGSWQPCFVVYDLLYMNGQSCLDMTYVQRSYKLQELLTEQQGVLQLMRSRKIGSIEEFNRMFQEVLDSKAEGIVIKKQNSIYRPGVRVGGGWYKDKADYINGLTSEFDLLIIGGFYNRKRTFIESFLLGVLKPSTGPAGRNEVYSVGRVSNNTQQRSVLNDSLKRHWHDCKQEPPPIWYKYKAGDVNGSPDVWIDPCNSTILQVKATDLVPSAAFFTPKSLHFPRTQLVRHDKVWNECMTLQEYTQLSQGHVAVKKITKRSLRLEDFTAERKRQKLTPAQRAKLGLAAYEKRYDAEKLEPISKLLEGITFCILTGSPRRRQSKQSLQELAGRNGGNIVENPLPNDENCVCVAGDITWYVELLIKQQPRTNNIVNMDWLLRVCEQQELVVRPKDVVAATESLHKELTQHYDKLGDSYTKAICSVSELVEILNDIDDAALQAADIDEQQLAAFEASLLSKSDGHFFRNCYAFFYTEADDGNDVRLELAKLRFMRHGGLVYSLQDLSSASQKSRLTHIFVELNRCNQDVFQQWILEQHLSHLPALSTEWITQSHSERRILNTQPYLLATTSQLAL
ncbi:DNA ligase 4-like [Scaptodrosophila lebanonensis]|uniref:DNA ligase 4 n=1 Tax=Drosophila lebanonensis TaxID=7225 RepID=A0A6J2TSL2_DROLE|nr:DNA ligase 4-like [Scaptodrosophila lebanonensis]